MHQPFHALGAAAGGNRVKVIVFGSPECGRYPCNLHGAWANELIQHAVMDVDEYVAHLNTVIREEHLTASGTPEDWANESHKYAEAAWLDNGAQIDDGYYRKEIRSWTRDFPLPGCDLPLS